MELGYFQLLSVLKDEILCNVDFANHHPWFSISQKKHDGEFSLLLLVSGKQIIAMNQVG